MNQKKALITQSNYIPWKGYFYALSQIDLFVIYDEMQYTKRDWRNRNKIKTANGVKWLTIPVKVKGKYEQKINETVINDSGWNIKHWNIIKQLYNKSPYFQEYNDFFEKLYLNCNEVFLSEINLVFIKAICKLLDIKVEFVHSKDLNLRGDKSEKLLNICKDLKVTDYYSGPAAKNYMNTNIFKRANINVHWFDYSSYPEYEQLYDGFEHSVSILDLIFNVGNDTLKYMKSNI